MNISRRTRRWLVIVAAIIIVLVLGFFTVHFYKTFNSLSKIKGLVEQLGIWGPLGIIALQVIQIVIAPVPGTLVALASGYLFGTGMGTVYSMIGIIIGTAIVLLLSRWLGRRIILLFMKKETLAKWDGRFQKWSLTVIFLLYLIPNPLGDMVSYLAGLTAWPMLTLIIIAVLGRLPFVAVSSFIGHKATALSAEEILLLIAGMIAVGVIYYFLRNRIEKLFLKKST
jgi:uncharacterized membrane protein YdjX (TVP38/TMEM64 family)